MVAHTRRNSTEVDKTCLVPKCTALYFITNNVLNIYSKSHREKKKKSTSYRNMSWKQKKKLTDSVSEGKTSSHKFLSQLL